MNNSLKTPVKNFLNWEKKKGKDTFLVQPIDGEYIEFTWERVGNEARKMCNYINSLSLPKKSKIAILSKNCAHWIIADLAIMMRHKPIEGLIRRQRQQIIAPIITETVKRQLYKYTSIESSRKRRGSV